MSSQLLWQARQPFQLQYQSQRDHRVVEVTNATGRVGKIFVNASGETEVPGNGAEAIGVPDPGG